MRRSFCVCLIVAIIFLASETGYTSGISPELEQRLSTIKVLEITTSNRDVLWDLRNNPDRADVIELLLYAEELTLEQIEILKSWLTEGRGVVVYATDNKYENPQVRSNRILNELIGQNITLESVLESEFYVRESNQRHPILVYSRHIRCSYSYGSSGYKVPYVIRRDKDVSFDSLFETKAGKPAVASWELTSGGRVVYLGCDVSYPFKKYKDRYDNARFWANTILWLAYKNT